MAQFESIFGDQTESPKNKQNNVTEFNKPASKTETATSRSSTSSRKTTSGGTAGVATAPARSLYDQAKETAGQAYEAVTDKAATKLDEQKSSLTGGLTTVADSVRQVSENLSSSKTDSGLAETAAKYTNTAAKTIEDVAGYFESRNVRDMARDLEGFARRNPAIFFGAAFGLGLLAARFLKSSSPGYYEKGAGRAFRAASTGTSDQPDPASAKTGAPDFSAKPL